MASERGGGKAGFQDDSFHVTSIGLILNFVIVGGRRAGAAPLPPGSGVPDWIDNFRLNNGGSGGIVGGGGIVPHPENL